MNNKEKRGYNPEQNRLGERLNLKLVERVRKTMFYGDLDKRFFAEVIATASHVINRSPTKSLSVTPEEKFSAKRSDLSYLRVFGARAASAPSAP